MVYNTVGQYCNYRSRTTIYLEILFHTEKFYFLGKFFTDQIEFKRKQLTIFGLRYRRKWLNWKGILQLIVKLISARMFEEEKIFSLLREISEDTLKKLYNGKNVFLVPWHSLYKHSLYVTKFIQTFFIRDKIYTGLSLYGTKFIRGQNWYGNKVYTRTKFIQDKVYTVTKFIRGQSLYKLFSSRRYNDWDKLALIRSTRDWIRSLLSFLHWEAILLNFHASKLLTNTLLLVDQGLGEGPHVGVAVTRLFMGWVYHSRQWWSSLVMKLVYWLQISWSIKGCPASSYTSVKEAMISMHKFC